MILQLSVERCKERKEEWMNEWMNESTKHDAVVFTVTLNQWWLWVRFAVRECFRCKANFKESFLRKTSLAKNFWTWTRQWTRNIAPWPCTSESCASSASVARSDVSHQWKLHRKLRRFRMPWNLWFWISTRMRISDSSSSPREYILTLKEDILSFRVSATQRS